MSTGLGVTELAQSQFLHCFPDSRVCNEPLLPPSLLLEHASAPLRLFSHLRISPDSSVADAKRVTTVNFPEDAGNGGKALREGAEWSGYSQAPGRISKAGLVS